ncbi:MAG: metallophosphoesterase family protein, partial [Nocardioidaceae bacterium]|nr:metallophosphoesterase family protein [Nocardioidaceae bacterium]
MRAAVFSDVHGNALALERVLQDADRCGVDEHWIAGDLVAHGPRPADTIRLL